MLAASHSCPFASVRLGSLSMCSKSCVNTKPFQPYSQPSLILHFGVQMIEVDFMLSQLISSAGKTFSVTRIPKISEVIKKKCRYYPAESKISCLVHPVSCFQIFNKSKNPLSDGVKLLNHKSNPV